MHRKKPKFTAEETVLKKILSHPDYDIWWGKHASERMKERGVTEADVRHVLESGSIVDVDFLAGTKVTIAGTDLDGRRVEVIAVLREGELVIKLVTVIRTGK